MNKPQTNTPQSKPKAIDIVKKGLAKRYRSERRFRIMGLGAIIASLVFLSFLFITIIGNGYTALFQTHIQIHVHFDPERLPQDQLNTADYPGIVKAALRDMFPEVKGRSDKRQLYRLVSSGAAFRLRKMVLENRKLIGTRQWVWVPADDDVDMLIKGHLERKTETGDSRFSASSSIYPSLRRATPGSLNWPASGERCAAVFSPC
ncbi:MAG: DUF3333 domain-containing protein [Desulfobacteraceae bacterium]